MNDEANRLIVYIHAHGRDPAELHIEVRPRDPSKAEAAAARCGPVEWGAFAQACYPHNYRNSLGPFWAPASGWRECTRCGLLVHGGDL